MITEVFLTNDTVAAQIHALAQAAYALEADLIGCPDFPPLRESLSDLQQSPDRFLVCEEFGQMIGALSFDHTRDSDSNLDSATIVITRLVISPAHLRQGLATALHAALQEHLPPQSHCRVSTAQANEPAIALYTKFGYTVANTSISPEGIPLVHFHLSKAAASS